MPRQARSLSVFRPETVTIYTRRVTRFNPLLILLIIILLLVVWRTLLWQPRKIPAAPEVSPVLIGHRGVRMDDLTENTLRAYRRALDSGLHGIEVDVRLSSDDRLVVNHDPTIGQLQVRQSTAAQLLQAQPEMPMLEEVLELMQQYPDRILNIEIKLEGMRGGGIERKVAQAVREHGLQDQTIISSFNPLVLARMRLAAPGMRTGLLTTHNAPAILRSGWLAGWLHTDSLNPHYSQVDAAMVERAHRNGLALYAWTVNDPQEVARLVGLGVDGLIADDPEGLKSAVAAAQTRQ